MAWNPLRAIGNAIGRVFGRGEQAPGPAPAPETAPTPEVSPPAVVPERRGGLAGLWDRVTGGDRRREEAAERERQLEERERRLEERERHLEERERAVAPPPIQAPEPAPAPPAPPTQAPEPAVAPPPPQAPEPAPAPERDMPKFIGGDAFDFRGQDEQFFGVDSDIERGLQEAVDKFIMDRGGLDGLTPDALEWLQNPTVSEPFGDYWHSSGFTAEQVLEGMTDIRNIQITEGDDGEIHIEFDYDAEVEDYEISGHASA